jgi:hypothetical protein
MVANLFFRHKRLLCSLPRQEGKTELGVRFLHDVTKRPFTSSSLFLAKDQPSGKKATREKFMRLFDQKKFMVNTEQVYLRNHPTSVIYMASVDKDPDRLRGGTYACIHWSEVAFSKLEKQETIIGVYDKVIKPTIRKTGGYVFLESTNNGKNGWYDLWTNAKEYGFHTFRLGLSDLVYMGLVTPQEYDEIQADTHPDVFKQEYECEFITFLGKTYSEFRHDVHIDPNMAGPENWQAVVSAIDWGYYPSATAVLFSYVQNGVLHIFDEHYEHKELGKITAEKIIAKQNQWKINKSNYAATADHEQDRIDELNLRGIECGKANKVNVMGARIQIKELFYFNRIKIHPRCKNLIRDLDAAVWDEKKEGELDETQCTWGHFDCEAALRYLVRELSGFEKTAPIVHPVMDSSSQAAFDIHLQRKLME